MKKRWTALILFLLLIWSSAAAEVTFWPVLDFTAEPMQLELSAEVISHMPYDDVRVQWLNGLLKHMKLTTRFQQVLDEQYQHLALSVDQQEVLTMSQCEDEQSSMVQLSLTPDMTYMASNGESALNLLMGLPPVAAEPDLLGITPQDLSWTSDGEQLLNLIRKEWTEQITNKADKQQISGYGNTTRRLTLSVAAADAEDFGHWMAEHCKEGPLAAVLEKLTFNGKQTLVWLIDNEDRVHKFTYTGNFTADGIDKRRLSVTWNMARTATTTKDSLTVKTPQTNEKTTEYNTLTWKRTAQEKNGAITDKEEFSYTQRLNKQKLVMSGSTDLKRVDTDGLSHYTGSIQLKRTLPGADEEQADLVLDVDADEMDSSILGTVTITTQTAKMNRESAVLHVKLTPCEPVTWNINTIAMNLDTMSDADLAALNERMMQQAARTIIKPLVLLPREDTLFLSQDLSDEAWNALVDAAMGK